MTPAGIFFFTLFMHAYGTVAHSLIDMISENEDEDTMLTMGKGIVLILFQYF